MIMDINKICNSCCSFF